MTRIVDSFKYIIDRLDRLIHSCVPFLVSTVTVHDRFVQVVGQSFKFGRTRIDELLRHRRRQPRLIPRYRKQVPPAAFDPHRAVIVKSGF
jgi:hypothetical protein